MQLPSRFRTWFALLLLAALAVRVAAGGWWQQRLPAGAKFGFGDSESYWVLAETIARGEPYQYGNEDARVFRTPGYPVILAGLFCLVDDEPPVLWARALSAVLGTLAVGAVVLLAWQLFDDRVALIAGTFAAFYPGAIAMSSLVLAEVLFCPLMLLQVICWTAACRTDVRKRQVIFAVLGGVAAGAATLARPSWLLFTPAAVLLAIAFGRQRRRHITIGIRVLLGLIIVMAPWWFRNYAVCGRFVPTTLQVGASLYDGINPNATGASDMRFVGEFYHAEKQASAFPTSPLDGTFEDRLDRRMRGASIQWARENPGRVVQLMGIKFVPMWNVWPNSSDMQSWFMRVVLMIGYTPLLILGVWGSVKFASRGWPYVLCFLPAIYFTCLHVVFVSSIRYRQPAMLPMIVLAAGICGAILTRLSRDHDDRPDPTA